MRDLDHRSGDGVSGRGELLGCGGQICRRGRNPVALIVDLLHDRAKLGSHGRNGGSHRRQLLGHITDGGGPQVTAGESAGDVDQLGERQGDPPDRGGGNPHPREAGEEQDEPERRLPVLDRGRDSVPGLGGADRLRAEVCAEVCHQQPGVEPRRVRGEFSRPSQGALPVRVGIPGFAERLKLSGGDQAQSMVDGERGQAEDVLPLPVRQPARRVKTLEVGSLGVRQIPFRRPQLVEQPQADGRVRLLQLRRALHVTIDGRPH